jgi:MoxR-like ATPase
LGPLGTAFCQRDIDKPRVLLIDEIDKSDIDIPNDLLNIFEEGEFIIPELFRLRDNTDKGVEVFSADIGQRINIKGGIVRCEQFPFVVLTSNDERDFPPAFLRRCLRLNLSQHPREKLVEIILAHLSDLSIDPDQEPTKKIIDEFENRRRKGLLANDQLLNAVFLISKVQDIQNNEILKEQIINVLLELLSTSTSELEEESN